MRLLHSVISISLVLFILAGSAGLRVFRHACEEDGIFTSYFIQLEDHCGEHIEKLPECCQKEHAVKDDCCSDEVDIYQVDFDYFQDFSVELPVFWDVEKPASTVWVTSSLPLPQVAQALTRPPPLTSSGKELLIKHQVFRI